MGKHIAFLNKAERSKRNLLNLGFMHWIMTYRTISIKRTLLLICLGKLILHTGGGQSIFDSISKDDIVIAFYPCIYFCATSQMAFSLGYTNYRRLTFDEKVEKILERAEMREEFYKRLIRLCAVCVRKGIRLIVENPWSEQTYLKANFIKAPDVVDNNRMLRGDYFKKPTAYWFWNCKPTYGTSYQNDKEQKTIMSTRGSSQAGLCSEDRSMISSDYARNFICDFILGKGQKMNQVSMFEDLQKV